MQQLPFQLFGGLEGAGGSEKAKASWEWKDLSDKRFRVSSRKAWMRTWWRTLLVRGGAWRFGVKPRHALWPRAGAVEELDDEEELQELLLAHVPALESIDATKRSSIVQSFLAAGKTGACRSAALTLPRDATQLVLLLRRSPQDC